MGAGPCKPAKEPEPEPDGEALLRAAILIQRWYRIYKARLEARRQATWSVFQSLEYKNEKDQMSLYNFFNDLLLHSSGEDTVLLDALGKMAVTDSDSKVSGDGRSVASSKQTEDNFDVNDIKVDQDYRGLRLHFPMDEEQLPKLTQYLAKKEELHAKYVFQMLQEMTRLLRQRGNVYKIPVNKKQPVVTVCGDIHGQLDDLLLIFYKNGPPSRSNPYVFNGDFVDRGEHSVECAMLLFAYFLVYPSSLCLNRGNHEDHMMNLRYGFVTEVIRKYDAYASRLIRMFTETFSYLPLATIVDKKVFIAHGGISDILDEKKLKAVKRHSYESILNPPQNNKFPEGHPKRIDVAEWRQILDVTWSDPKNTDGCEANTFRGGGCYWGADVTRHICKKHGWKLIVRSHECKQEGYEWTHGGRVLTIFSASNYYQVDSNKGAYIKLNKGACAGRENPQIIQFQVMGHHDNTNTLTMTDRITQQEEKAMASLRDKIFSMRKELRSAFELCVETAAKDSTSLPPPDSGFVTIAQWCDVMKVTTGLQLPWRSIRTSLGIELHKDKFVRYEDTLKDLKLVAGPSRLSCTSNEETLYKHRERLSTIFRAIDTDNSGFISRKEFFDACKLLGKVTRNELSDKDVLQMAKNIDINNDGKIDISEFLETFRLVNNIVAT